MLTIVKITIKAGEKGKFYLYALRYAERIWFVTRDPFHFGKTEMIIGEVDEIPYKYLGERVKGKVAEIERFEVNDDLVRLEFGVEQIWEGRYRGVVFWGFKVYPPMSPEEFEENNFIPIN